MSSTKRCTGHCGRILDATTEFYRARTQCKRCYNDLTEARRLSMRSGKSRAEELADILARRCTPEDERILGAQESGQPDSASGVSRWAHLERFDREMTAEESSQTRPEPATKFDVTDIKQEPRVEVVQETITRVEEHRLKREVSDLRSQLKQLTAELSDAQALGDIYSEARQQDVPPITPRERAGGQLREATALACASDWHIEEEVKPEQVSGRNRYNLDISRRRMERFFEATRWAINFNRQIFTIRDLVLWLGGDIITNYLHPDNVETNLLAPPEALAYAHASIVTGIRYLLEDAGLERIVVPCNDGNHGRMTQKMRSAARTQSSLEILLYRMIAQEFADEPRVQFLIAGGEHLYFDVYGRTIRFVHGDSVRYGGGVGGITIPLYKALARWETMRRADLTVVGHFHQRIVLPDLMVNSSLIGYSPYSLTIGARFEPPSQNFSILEPQRFRSVDLPLWVGERDDDDQGYQ